MLLSTHTLFKRPIYRKESHLATFSKAYFVFGRMEHYIYKYTHTYIYIHIYGQKEGERVERGRERQEKEERQKKTKDRQIFLAEKSFKMIVLTKEEQLAVSKIRIIFPY